MKIKKLLILAISIFIITGAFAQEKPSSYWVIADNCEQMEVFQNITPPNPNGSRAAGSLTTLFASNNQFMQVYC